MFLTLLPGKSPCTVWTAQWARGALPISQEAEAHFGSHLRQPQGHTLEDVTLKCSRVLLVGHRGTEISLTHTGTRDAERMLIWA